MTITRYFEQARRRYLAGGDVTFYEPPHDLGHKSPLNGWMTRPDA
jgi:hypothetical protein